MFCFCRERERFNSLKAPSDPL
uniref:Uncharacterized protein n=1 Tax=Rhizophora mucronata TaxID=61149 RepID=A0A2P2IIJ4_RHIMU